MPILLLPHQFSIEYIVFLMSSRWANQCLYKVSGNDFLKKLLLSWGNEYFEREMWANVWTETQDKTDSGPQRCTKYSSHTGRFALRESLLFFIFLFFLGVYVLLCVRVRLLRSRFISLPPSILFLKCCDWFWSSDYTIITHIHI